MKARLNGKYSRERNRIKYTSAVYNSSLICTIFRSARVLGYLIAIKIAKILLKSLNPKLLLVNL